MTLKFWIAMLLSAPVTALLLGPASPLPGFGRLPGDMYISGEGFAVILPFASSALTLIAIYGALQLADEVRRLTVLRRG